MSIPQEQLVVITGASAGLGKRVCENLLSLGYKVVGLSRRGEAPEGAIAKVCDVSDYASVEAALEDVSKDKSLYALINCAGIASMNLVMATPPETINRIIATNLIGTINTCRMLSKRFARNKGGRIINFSTVAVPISLKGEAIYVASKAGVEGFSKSFAREMADFNTTVNVIAPGPIDTQLIAGVPHAAIERIIERQIIPHRFTPDSVEALVRFILSEDSHMLSGQILNIGGA